MEKKHNEGVFKYGEKSLKDIFSSFEIKFHRYSWGIQDVAAAKVIGFSWKKTTDNNTNTIKKGVGVGMRISIMCLMFQAQHLQDDGCLLRMGIETQQ